MLASLDLKSEESSTHCQAFAHHPYHMLRFAEDHRRAIGRNTAPSPCAGTAPWSGNTLRLDREITPFLAVDEHAHLEEALKSFLS